MLLIDFIVKYQLNIMLVLSGICATLAFFVIFTGNLRFRKKYALLTLELGATLLLIADRFAYIYRGDISTTGYWMVRICNFLVFFFSITIIYSFNSYLIDLYRHEVKLEKLPLRLRINKIIAFVAIVSLIISQRINLYYYFDEQNRYVRGSGFLIWYLFPLLMFVLDLSVVFQHYKKLRRIIRIPLMIFSVLPVLAAAIQFFAYGLSLINISIVGGAILLYFFVLIDMNSSVEKANQIEINYLKDEQKKMRILFEQTATALATAIDAKDEYTHGHSMRVAEYSLKIAKLAGKDENFCSQVYYAGLLHDVGKIGIADGIINKTGKLTDEEFAEIKKHPVIGKQILSSISQSPYLSIGANYHHERYDGHGYPEGLKGDDIPELARIIAVADAYDAMTSKRSYRKPIPQEVVREEIVKGSGSQFDPEFARLMLHLIDLDLKYKMKEQSEVQELAGKNELTCADSDTDYSEGFLIDQNIFHFKMHCIPDKNVPFTDVIFTILLFDSLDGRIHYDEIQGREMNYTEFAKINFDGTVEKKAAREIKNEIIRNEISDFYSEWENAYNSGLDFEGEAVKIKDHVQVKLISKFQTMITTVALPDNSRFSYLSLTGLHCQFSNVEVFKSDEKVASDYIPRIADEISYIEGPEGDIPSIQLDGWCTAFSEPVILSDNMTISFHAKSLPTARLIWHCPYIRLYHSDDKKPNGKNFREFVLVRIDGENWEGNGYADNSIAINHNENFEGWTVWKSMLKTGIDCKFNIRIKGNKITVFTENCGIAIKSTTVVKDMPNKVYAVLTGDQCVISNIKISQNLK